MEKDPETKPRVVPPGELTKDSGIATATGVPMATNVTAADVMKKYIEEEGASNLINKFAENIGKITKDYSGENLMFVSTIIISIDVDSPSIINFTNIFHHIHLVLSQLTVPNCLQCHFRNY